MDGWKGPVGREPGAGAGRVVELTQRGRQDTIALMQRGDGRDRREGVVELVETRLIRDEAHLFVVLVLGVEAVSEWVSCSSLPFMLIMRPFAVSVDAAD